MKIGGFHKLSLTDYPGFRTAIVYVQGCNWRCPYCFHRSLVIPTRFQPSIPEDEVLTYLRDHRADLEAICITGGEPTQQSTLIPFVRQLRKLGLKIKLDTHGGRPAVLAELFNERLVDFVAIDVKGPLDHYERFAGCPVDPGVIELSLDLVAHSGVPYEIRTTLVEGLHTRDDLEKMAPLVAGSKRFVLQSYRHPPGLKPTGYAPPGPELFSFAGDLLREHVDEFIVR